MTVDAAELVFSEIERAGNGKRTVGEESINTPIEKAVADQMVSIGALLPLWLSQEKWAI